MRIIHCSDLHLDSRMRTHMDSNKARERKSELLGTFQNMIKYAGDRDVSAVIIAGDMFDTASVSAGAKITVLSVIKNNPSVDFIILKGNHDDNNFVASLTERPENLKIFGEGNEVFAYGDIRIYGAEPPYYSDSYSALELEEDKFNIVIMHGQITNAAGRDPELINLKSLAHKNIDYLALGHEHSYKKGNIDERGIWVYSGCLEGRGFDECGDKGFVLLDIDEDNLKFRETFVSFAKRRIFEISVDISECCDTYEAEKLLEEALEAAGCDEDSLVKIILTGELDVETEMDEEAMAVHFDTYCYYIKIDNKTTIKVDPNHFLHDETLKGEFVRQVLGSEEIEEDEKAVIIRYGIKAISGEEIA